MADEDQETQGRLARVRTDFSEDRTVLANERTFAGWLRTGYAGIGIGLAFNALFNRVDPPWIPKLIATAFLLIAVMIFIAAERRACAVFSRLETHRVKSVKLSSVRAVTIANVLATVALIAAIWGLSFEAPSRG
ncbi:MAG: YidH family protein [Sphingomicrobium sp.]